jgi:N-acetylglucosamine-6-phosphate deacetylase
MKKMYITGGQIVTPDRVLVDQTLVIVEDKIVEIASNHIAPSEEDTVIRVNNCTIAPGFIDIHVHGGQGFDTMDAAPEAIYGLGRFLAQHGVTSFFPTTVSSNPVSIWMAIETLGNTSSDACGASPLGLHIEGPYLNQAFRGAHSQKYIRPADPFEYGTWFNSKKVRLITVAPEVPGALDLIDAGKREGVKFALGHSGATYDQAVEAFDHGLCQTTHVFNGMPELHHRDPGALLAVLTDQRVFTQIIADGIHVHPRMVKFLLHQKGLERTILISDSIRAAGMPDGEYFLGEEPVRVIDGIARTGSGGLAGSTLTLDQALRNVMEYANLSLAEALPMATSVPAQAMGLKNRKGVLIPGADADIVVLNRSNQVCITIVGGRIVYQDTYPQKFL